jgi:transcriptional regulator with GAF, ATPase, and Fis domain
VPSRLARGERRGQPRARVPQDEDALGLSAVLQATEAVGSDADLAETLRMVASAAAEVMQATRASISLRDGRTRGDLYLAAAVGLSPEYVGVLNGRHRGQVGRGVSGTAMQSRRPVVVPDVATDPGFEDCRPSRRSGRAARARACPARCRPRWRTRSATPWARGSRPCAQRVWEAMRDAQP